MNLPAKQGTLFYHYSQNNSGGVFDYDYERGITHHVIIEASDYIEANYLAERIGLYFDGQGDCDCCGDRWNPQWMWSSGGTDPGTDTPMVYGEPAAILKHDGWRAFMKYEGFIHFKDGRKVGFAHESGPGLQVPKVPKAVKGPLKAIGRA